MKAIMNGIEGKVITRRGKVYFEDGNKDRRHLGEIEKSFMDAIYITRNLDNKPYTASTKGNALKLLIEHYNGKVYL